jgi:hypothetical protein
MHPEQPPSFPHRTPPPPAHPLRFAKLGFALGITLLALPSAAPAQTSTTTMLTITSGGSPITTVKQGTLVTLTATVTTANGLPVSPGQVRFCEVKPPRRCTDVLLLQTAQLLTSGIATYKYHPGAGTHIYRAEFAGTHVAPAAVSSTSQLIVTPYIPTTTAVTESGGNPYYTFTATVSDTGGVSPPTGTVTFTDQTNQNYVLGTGNLVPAIGSSGISFADINTPAVYFSVLDVVALDMNGDGWPDILWTPACGQDVSGGSIGAYGAAVNVLLGNGDGTFTAKPRLPAYGLCLPAQGLALGDFNSDGIPDFAAPFIPDTNSLTYLQAFLGKGDGTFTAGQAFDAPPADALSPTSGILFQSNVVSADFNGDGIPDLAVTSTGSAAVTVMFGNGDGTFTAGPSTPVGNRPLPILAADFNGDGIMDLLANTTSASGSFVLSILLGNGDGTFKPPVQLSANNAYSAFAADFDGDGVLDLALEIGGTVSTNGTMLCLGNGDGTFRCGSEIPTYVVELVADLNNDGLPDMVATGGDATNAVINFHVFLGNGDGTFQPPVPLSSGLLDAGPFAVADFNGDGLADIAAGVTGSYNSTVQYPLYMSTLLSEFNPQVATLTVNNAWVLGDTYHTIEAAYSGDNTYRPSGTSLLLLAAQQPTTLTVTAIPAPSAYGQQVALTAAVVPGTAENQVATGTVTFSYGKTQLGSATVSNGVATLNVTTLPVGTDTVTATYSGDNNFTSSIGSTAQVVSGYASVTSLATSANPGGLGQPIVLTASIAGAATSLIPTGSVVFSDGATQLASVPLDATGHATFTTSTLALGTHTLTAAYAGDAIFTSSASAPLSELIIQPNFTLTLSNPTITLRTYQHITTSATLAANSTGTVAFYLDTDSILGNGGLARNLPPAPTGSPTDLALLLFPATLCAALTRRKSARSSKPIRLLLLLAALALPAALALNGCGGNQIAPVPSAAPGTYIIPVTATATTTGLIRTAQLTLTVTP